MSEAGHEYIGQKAETVSGRNCQSWSSQDPHNHTYIADHMYPDRSVYSAMNYCRNPNYTWVGLWCFTTDPSKRWEECDVPTCGKSTC